MDLSTIKPEARAIEIKHPGLGTPLGVRLNMISMDDDRLQPVKRAITDRRLYLEQRGKNFKAEEIEENTRRILFTACTGWEWYNPTGSEGDDGYDPAATPDFHGEQPEFNQKNFNAILKELPWFSDQITEELGETKAFFDGSKPS